MECNQAGEWSSLVRAPFLFLSINQDDQPGQPGNEHQAAERLTAAHAEEVHASEVGVGPAEKFDKETEQPVAHQVQARHLVPEQRDAPQVVQECEQNNAFEAHLVQLARVVQNRILDRTVVSERKVHADGARSRFAEEFPVDEVAPAPPGIGKRCGQET